jgi:hypothetical protein
MAGTYDTNIPGSPGYLQAQLIAKKAYQEALARINAQRTGTLRQYGYLGDIDPTTGTLRHVRVDPHNLYGQYQQMLGSQAGEDQAALDEAAARGLHGGLARQMVSRLHREHGGQSAALGQNLTGTLADFQDQQNQAAQVRDSALYEAELQAARDAIAAQQFNPADVSGVPMPAYGDGTSSDNTDLNAGTGQELPGRPPHIPSGTPTVSWNGHLMTRTQLVRLLAARGVAASTWARNHPSAAKTLGLSARVGANNKIIKAALAGRRR